MSLIEGHVLGRQLKMFSAPVTDYVLDPVYGNIFARH